MTSKQQLTVSRVIGPQRTARMRDGSLAAVSSFRGSPFYRPPINLAPRKQPEFTHARQMPGLESRHTRIAAGATVAIRSDLAPLSPSSTEASLCCGGR